MESALFESLSNLFHSKSSHKLWWSCLQKILVYSFMSAPEDKTTCAICHGRSSFRYFPKPILVPVMSASLSSPRHTKASLRPVLNSHLSTTVLLRKFQKAESKEQRVPKRPRKQDDVLSPLFLASQHISKLQDTNACEPKHLPRFLDDFCAPAFLPTSIALSSKR